MNGWKQRKQGILNYQKYYPQELELGNIYALEMRIWLFEIRIYYGWCPTAAWWVPLVTNECFRCLGASHGRLTSKGCSLLPRQDRQGSSPTSLDSGALLWPSPQCSLGQLQHQQVKWIACLWVTNVVLAKVIKTGSKEVLTETSNYPITWSLTPR